MCAFGIDVENVVYGVRVTFQFGVAGVDGCNSGSDFAVLICAQVDVEVLVEAEIAVQIIGIVGQEPGGVVTGGNERRLG